MALCTKASALIDSLASSVDKLEILLELRTLMSVVSREELLEVAPNVSFNVIFECLNTTNEEQLSACSAVLGYLMEAMEPVMLLEHFHQELLAGLGHPATSVKMLSLSQVMRACKASPQCVASQIDILVQLAALLGDDDLEMAKKSTKILGKLTENNETLSLLMQPTMQEQLAFTMEKSDTIRFRVYEAVIHIASQSPDALDLCDKSGILQKLVNEVGKDDILVQLNCLEILKEMALFEHGLAYLDRQGIVTRMETLLKNAESDPLAGFLLPGLVKFFGNIAYIRPKEVCDRYESFVNAVFNLLDSGDVSERCLGVETVGFIGSTVEGKMALQKYGSQMANACRHIGRLMQESPTEIRVKSMQALVGLLQLKVAEQTSELLELTETWFKNIERKPVEMIMSIASQPFPELRTSALKIFETLAMTPWGQTTLNNHPGFNEYLLDRSTEKSKEGKEGKYDIVKTLVESPTAQDTFDAPYFLRLREYLRDGPFWVRVEAAVAFEEAS